MTRRFLFLASFFLIVGLALGKPVPPAKEEAVPLDPVRAKEAKVVLRVKLERPLGGESGVDWYRVRVLKVLKEAPGISFDATLDVATYNRKFGPGNPRVAGVPTEECTIYLEPLRNSMLWALLGGQAEKGVSHVAEAGK